MNPEINKICSGVIYDVLTYDLKYKDSFLLSNEIKVITGSKIFGPAFTVQGKYCFNRFSENEELAMVIEMLPNMSEGVVEVLSCGYNGPVASWGDFTATLVRKSGCIGAVTDGFTRDVKGLREMKFSLYCKGTCCINGFGSGWQIVDYLCRVELPGLLGTKVIINPGDYIFGDEDGVLVIPENLKNKVIEIAIERIEKEVSYKEKVRKNEFSLEELKKTIFEW